jgi:hypothetical protein
MPLTFGGAAIESAEVTWPGGRVEKLGALAPGQTYIVEEGRGIINRIPFAPSSAATPNAGRPQ